MIRLYEAASPCKSLPPFRALPTSITHAHGVTHYRSRFPAYHGEIYRVRANLLELIAGDIARDVSLDDIRTLQPIMQVMETASKAGDVNAYFWANIDFHERNTELAGNRTVKKIVDSLLLRTLRLRRISLSQPGRLQKSYEDHERLCRAYEDRDPTLAAALIRSNHVTGLSVLENIFSQ